MPSSGSFLRQLSGKEAWKSSSKRWGGNNSRHGDGGCERSLKQMEGLNMYGGENGGWVMRWQEHLDGMWCLFFIL